MNVLRCSGARLVEVKECSVAGSVVGWCDSIQGLYTKRLCVVVVLWSSLVGVHVVKRSRRGWSLYLGLCLHTCCLLRVGCRFLITYFSKITALSGLAFTMEMHQAPGSLARTW